MKIYTSPQQVASQLDKQFAVENKAHVVVDEHDQVAVVVDTPVARGKVYLHGGHISEYQPAGHQPVLFMSEASRYQRNEPIRGGVPVCFPWFGNRKNDPNAVAHGTARISPWELVNIATAGDDVRVRLAVTIDDLEVHLTASFGQSLIMAMEVENRGTVDATYEQALHTYFSVGNVKTISIHGLESYAYLDKLQHMARIEPASEPIQFAGEVDRVYLTDDTSTQIVDPTIGRTISIDPTGSRSTIVWNPWINKAAAMPDFGDDQWPSMVCVETGNVGDRAITLQPGECSKMTATIKPMSS